MAAPRLPGSSLLHDLRARGLVPPIVLALLVGGLLVQGALARRGGAPVEAPSPAPAPVPSATPFRPELEKVPLTYFSDYWLQLAERTQGALVNVGRTRVPAVRVHPGYALTSIGGADFVSAEATDATKSRLVAADAREGVALVRPSTEAEPLAPTTALHAGTLLALVSLDSEGGVQVTPGHLASAPPDGAEDLDVAVAYPASLDIAAVVDLDGRLAGVAVRTRHGVRVLSARGAGALADRLAAAPVCRGVEVSGLSVDLRAALGLRGGVLVERIWPEAFPTPPDLRGGDVLLRWDGKSLSSPESFAAAYDGLDPGTAVPFVASRGGRRVTGEVEMPGRDGRPAGMTPRESPRLGAVAQWTPGDLAESPAAGIRLLRVPDGSRAGQAGLGVGDVILAVDGQALPWPRARHFLDSEGPKRRASVLTVGRAGSVRLVPLPSPKE